MNLDSLQTKEKSGIQITPNSGTGQFTLTLTKQNTTLSAVRIIDIAGRTVFVSNEGNKRIEAGYTKVIYLNVPKGTYYFSAITKNGVLQSKLVIVR